MRFSRVVTPLLADAVDGAFGASGCSAISRGQRAEGGELVDGGVPDFAVGVVQGGLAGLRVAHPLTFAVGGAAQMPARCG
ncbi:hypothetical protein [Streptomyces filamentosus]|uniref:hypothetical protein n=1 Tax=Streptomyces filamentosus TaxID=67294 RepID=UPI001F24907F|nr:hypothetical protein [Streptomyces filamentosus]